MKIEKVPLGQLTPDPDNAKEHTPKQIAQIKASIERFGNNDPIAVWGKDNIIVEGHGRYEALKALGYKEAEIIRLDRLTDEERRAYALAHNQLTMNTGWLDGIFEKNLDAIESIDMADFGFDVVQADADIDTEITEDEIPEIDEQKEPTAKRGDIWKLGDHRLMCGDSTSKDDVDLLMNGQRPVFVFTDPPYGVSIGSKNKALNEIDPGKRGRVEDDIENDTLSTDELYHVLVAAFTNLRTHCDDGCSYYVSSPQGGELGLMMMMMRDAGLAVRHMLIWVKSSPCFSMGRLDYDYKHEPIFYTWTKKHTFYGGYGNTVIDDTKNLNKMSKAELKDMLHAIIDKNDTSVIYVDKPQSSTLHPTMKPVKLVARFMHNSSKKGDAVADIFGGSGTTLIAAEQMGRKCYMMELDPHYCDVIIQRWENFTGKKSELLNE